MTSVVRVCVVTIFVSISSLSWAQKTADVYVDKEGVLRWGKSGEEVHAFGANYTVPFAYAYRTAKQLNVSIEKAIDDDVYHFARLGFDAFRVHVWDCEISDTLGNLLSNEHLRLFDYAVARMKERGIKFMITPIAYWGNGYPMPDEETPGFSRKYGKDACLTNPEAIKAQERYLYQFVNHVNQYTGIAYKNDPDVILFEVCNEPHHAEAPEKVTVFIDKMISAIRHAGCKKPVLYNISHKVHLADAYFKSRMQGGTFQWYPTGLGFGQELAGNILPNVDKYEMPFGNAAGFNKIAKVVYEFDAADVGRSYIYPAMARSFRTAGIQLATHFAYDPAFTAYANTEYGTHYMNLAYAPQKALSLKIASEVFHSMPRYKDYGTYPKNTTFGDVHVSYEEDLAELVSDKKYFYTNNTRQAPSNEDKLEQIAGFGNSPVIKYEGTGAYFLDKIDAGTWRLEVMPDAIWVNDPFGKTSLKREVSVINYRFWPMSISLNDLGSDFTINAVNKGNGYTTEVHGNQFLISPGAYIITRKGNAAKPDGKFGTIQINEFVAPSASVNKTYVLHAASDEIASGEAYKIKATVVSRKEPEEVFVTVYGRSWRPVVLPMARAHGYSYEAVVPTDLVKEGLLRYYITVNENGAEKTYPDVEAGSPGDWDFVGHSSYSVRVIAKHLPVYLFSANVHAKEVMRQWIASSVISPSADPGKAELIVPIEKLFETDAENNNALPVYDYSMRYAFAHKLDGRLDDLVSSTKVVVRGRSMQRDAEKIQIALVSRDGSAYGSEVVLEKDLKDYVIRISDLKRVPLVTLPRPYPSFLPYYFNSTNSAGMDLKTIEGIQISIGPGLSEPEQGLRHTFSIESVRVE